MDDVSFCFCLSIVVVVFFSLPARYLFFRELFDCRTNAMQKALVKILSIVCLSLIRF